MSSLLFTLPGTTTRRTDVEVLARLFIGPRRRARVERLQAQRRALASGTAMQRAWPGRLFRKIGWTFVLKYS